MEQLCTYYESPIGTLKIAGTDKYINEVLFVSPEMRDETSKEAETVLSSSDPLPAMLRQCVDELIEYFQGERRTFDIPVFQEGTEFQQLVWGELQSIAFGKTTSYKHLAQTIGDIKAVRAVAAANGRNKIMIIVPCHRVIGSNSDLTGYAGGIKRKKWLLQHENKIANGVQLLF